MPDPHGIAVHSQSATSLRAIVLQSVSVSARGWGAGWGGGTVQNQPQSTNKVTFNDLKSDSSLIRYIPKRTYI